MGVGRRRFLQVCGHALTAFGTQTTNAAACAEEVYVNRKLGISFRIPAGWRVTNIDEFAKVAEGQIYAPEDFKLTSEHVEMAGLPFVAIERNLDDRPKFTPNVQFYLVERFPFLLEFCALAERLDGMLNAILHQPLSALRIPLPRIFPEPPMLRRARYDLKACAELLKSFTTIEKPAKMTLRGCPSATYTATWLFEHVDMPMPVRVRVKTIFTQHKKNTYLIRLIDSPYGDAGDAFCFDGFLKSVVLA